MKFLTGLVLLFSFSATSFADIQLNVNSKVVYVSPKTKNYFNATILEIYRNGVVRLELNQQFANEITTTNNLIPLVPQGKCIKETICRGATFEVNIHGGRKVYIVDIYSDGNVLISESPLGREPYFYIGAELLYPTTDSIKLAD